MQAGSFEALERGRDDESVDAVTLEKCEAVDRPEHERGGGESVRGQRGWRDDGDTRGRRGGSATAAIEDVDAGIRTEPLVVTRCTHGSIGDMQRINQRTIGSRVANANGPRRPSGITSAEIQVAAGIDRKIFEPLKLAGSGVDRKPLGDRAEVK